MSLEQFGKALEAYRKDCGGYPNLRVGLKALVANPGVNGWDGPYTKLPLRDPWGRPYLYEISNGLTIVRSFGADGKPGGDLFDGDLSSQNPWPPLQESEFHATRRFFAERGLRNALGKASWLPGTLARLARGPDPAYAAIGLRGYAEHFFQ